MTGVISTASFGSPGKMSLRFKKSVLPVKKEGKALTKGKEILEVQLRHGDVATMCDTRLQALTDVSKSNSRTQAVMTSTNSKRSMLLIRKASGAMQ